MTDRDPGEVLGEFARKLVRDAFLEGVKNGRQNRSHPSERRWLDGALPESLERTAYDVGWHRGRADPNAPAAAGCEEYVRSVFGDPDPEGSE